MEVYRICKAFHAENLLPSGTANRWNKQGQNVIYAGSTRALSTLELLVHKNSIVPSLDYRVMVISLEINLDTLKEVKLQNLPKNWQTLAAYSTLQEIGANWYINQESLALKVPSAVIPFEHNFVINCEHPDFNQNIKLLRNENFFWDNRLF